MSYFDYEWLGFVSTPEDATRIVTDTGTFYLAISVAYLLSFLYMLWHCPEAGKKKKTHGLGIAMWALFGGCLILAPVVFSIFMNFFVVFLSLLVLYQLYYTNPLTAQATLVPPKTKTDDKKLMYTETLLGKMNHSLADLLKFTLINEQILWLLILYRASITLRASFGL